MTSNSLSKHDTANKVFFGIAIWIMYLSTNFTLIIATLDLPVLLWDHFTFARMMFGGLEFNINSALYIWWKNVLGVSGFVYRPTLAFYNYVLFSLFGYQFWIFYLVKWIVFFCTVWLYADIAKRLGVSKYLIVFLLAFLLFHPAHPVLMLFSADLIVATLTGLVIRFALLDGPMLDAKRLSPLRATGIALLLLFAIGQKEVSVLLIGSLVLGYLAVAAFWDFYNKRPVLFGLLPKLLAAWSILLVVYSLFMLGAAAHHRHLTTGNFDLNLRVVAQYVSILFPQSPLGLLAIVGLLAALVWIWRLALSARALMRDRGAAMHQALVFLIGAAAAVGVIFSSIGQSQAAMRYVIPSAYLAALFFTVALDRAVPRRFHGAFNVLAFLIPVWNLGTIYAQAWGYQQLGWEMKSMMGELSAQAKVGTPIVDNLYWGEHRQNIKDMFSPAIAPKLGLVPANVTSLSNWPNEAPPDNAVVLTDLSRLTYYRPGTEIVVADLDRNSTLQATYVLFKHVAGVFGLRSGGHFDVGAPSLNSLDELVNFRKAIIRPRPEQHAGSWRVIHPCDLEPRAEGDCRNEGRQLTKGAVLSLPLDAAGAAPLLELRLDAVGAGYVGIKLGKTDVSTASFSQSEGTLQTILRRDIGGREGQSEAFFVVAQTDTIVKSLAWRSVPVRMLSVPPTLGALE